MGKADTVTKVFMRKNENFAAAYNCAYYGGKRVILPEHLQEMDSTELAVLHGEEAEKPEAAQKYRDVVKKYVNGDQQAYLILCIENQTEIHYGMPVKTMLYDALQYDKQISNFREIHRSKGEHGSAAEFVSGIHKDDRLIPVLTLTTYFGNREWDGPRSLHAMLQTEGVDAQLIESVPDYPIRLITPKAMTEEDFRQLEDTEFGGVMKFIKLSKDEQKLQQYLAEKPQVLQELSVDGVDVLNVVTNSKIRYEKGNEVVNVCLALDMMEKHAVERGHAEVFAMLNWLMSQNRSEEAAQLLLDLDLRERLFAEYRQTLLANA